MKRSLLVPIGLIALIVAIAASLAWRNRELRLVAVLPSVGGLRTGAPVVHSTGMLIGRVERMRTRGRRVLADVRMGARDVELLRSDSVRLRTVGIGETSEQVLEIVRGDSSAPAGARRHDLLLCAAASPAPACRGSCHRPIRRGSRRPR